MTTDRVRRVPARDRDATVALVRMWALDLQGYPRRLGRARWLLGVVTGWLVLGTVAVAASADALREEVGVDPLPVVSGLALVVFSLAPLVGGSGTEAAGVRSLARFPVPPVAVFRAAWIQSLADVQFVLIAPVLCGLAVREGPLALVGAVVFLAIVSGIGVVSGYGGVVLAGRGRRPALVVAAMAVGIAASVVMTAAVLDRSPADLVADVGRFVPAFGAADPSAIAAAVLVVGALQALGPTLVRAAWRADARGVPVREHAAGLRPGSVAGALVLAEVRGMLRPVPVRLSLVSMPLVPFVALLAPGERVSLEAIAPVVVLSLAVVLSVNGFAFAGGGVGLLAAAPIPASTVLLVRFAASAFVVAVAAGGSIVVAAWFVPVGGSVASLGVAVVAPLVACCGVTVWTSVRWPAFADYDSVRVRPAPVTALAGAVAICLPVVTAIGVLAGAGPVGALGGIVLGGVVAAVAGRAAVRRCDLEAILLAVR